MKEYTFEPKKVCANKVKVVLDDENKIYDLKIIGGCPGNGLAVTTLAEGMTKDDFVKKLKGIKCGNRGTSCVDQIAKFLEISIVLPYKEV